MEGTGRDTRPEIRSSANLSCGLSGFTLDATGAGNFCRTGLCTAQSSKVSRPRPSDDLFASRKLKIAAVRSEEGT